MIVPNSDVSGSGRAVRAANEYAKFASEATGASVGWLREKAFTDGSKNIISIGETARLSEANFGLDILFDLLLLAPDSTYHVPLFLLLFTHDRKRVFKC